MARRQSRKGENKTDNSEMEGMSLESKRYLEEIYRKCPGTRPTPEESDELARVLAENPIIVTFPDFPVRRKPHCPQELVKSLRKQGIRVRLPGPLEERLQNDLMMEGWRGKGPKDDK